MTVRESRGTVRGKTSEAGVPHGATVKKGSKGLVKSKAKLSVRAEGSAKRGMEEKEKKTQTVEDMPGACKVKNSFTEVMADVRKEYSASSFVCRITFRLPKEAVGKARRVTVVGDFNEWDREASPLKKLKNGDFEAIIEVPAGKEYRFRYLIDGHRWENDWCADKYEKNPFGCDDSVVIV